MAADFKLNIPITADGRSAVSNLNETADSASKLFKELVKGEATVKEFDAAMGEDLAVAARKAGEGFKAIEAQYKTILPLFEKARQKFSENANATEDQRQAYKDLEATYKVLKEEVDKKRAADDAEAEAIRKRNAELRKQAEEDQRIIDYLHEMAEAQDEYNAKLREQAGLSARINANYDNYINGRISSASAGAAAMPGSIAFNDANLRFYRQVGDEVAYAQEELRLYEEQLRRVLEAENASPAAIDSATQSYLNQRGVVENLTKTSGNAVTKLLSVAKNILKFQLLMGPITAAIRGFRNTISDSIKAAAEAEQVFSKLSTVFSGLEDSANKAATAIASKLGVATSTAASSLSTVADLLQAQGMGTAQSLTTASQWVSQFSDIIAFKNLNMSLEEFAQNFMSGAAGNLRNFRTFGSIVKESAVNAELAKKGLDKLTGSQLELAKMTTRANMALEQQANAMGATKREWNDMLSVNRRYEETTKSLKENLGELINTALKPAKAWWTEILNTMNKAVKAANEYAKGVRNIAVYDVKNNAGDKAMFRSALRDTPATLLNQNFSAQNLNADNFVDSEYMSQLDAIDRLLVMYSVTVKEFAGYLKEWGYESVISASTIKFLTQKEKERNAELEKQAAIEKRRTNIEGIASGYDSFTETLKAITGVNINTPDWTAQSGQFAYFEGGENLFKANVGSSIMKAITDSLDSLDVGSLDELSKKFGDVIAGALDELDEGDLRSAQIESVRKLFEATWNEFAEGGFTDDELKILEAIRAKYAELNKELEDYNLRLELEKIAKAEEAKEIQRIIENSGYFTKQFAALAKESEKTVKDYQLQIFKDLADSYGLLVNGESQANNFNVFEQRKQYQFDDGSYGTVFSMTHFDEATQAWYVLPEIMDGVFVGVEGALKNFYDDSIYLGKFATEQEAEQYAVAFHLFDQYISDNIDIINDLAKAQDEYNRKLKEEEALKVAQSTAKDYRTQLNNFGLSDYQITLNDINAKEANAQTGAEANYYSDAARDFVNITAKQVAAAFNGMAYAADIATIGMKEHEKELYLLEQEYLSQKALLEGINADTTELDNNYEAQRQNLIALHDAQDKYNAELERQAKVATDLSNAEKSYKIRSQFASNITPRTYSGQYASADQWYFEQQMSLREAKNELAALGMTAAEIQKWSKDMMDDIESEYNRRKAEIDKAAYEAYVQSIKDAWSAVGDRALAGTGTLGGVVQSFKGDGDIWTKILNAILTILENTEGWSELAATINQIFEMFEPVMDAIMDLIVSLPWDIIIFCLKVIASAIVVIAKTIEMVVDIIVWVWDNIKAAIHNIIETIKHPFNKGARNTMEYRSWEDLKETLDDAADKEAKYLEKIWGCAYSIDRKMDDDKDLALLRDLWNRNIISEQTYYKESGSLHGNYLPTPVTPTYPTSRTVSIGNISLTFTGNNPEEIARAVGKVFKQYTGYDFTEAMPMTSGGY